MDEVHSPITTIPGIGTRMGAMILAEIGDFSSFDSADYIMGGIRSKGRFEQALRKFGLI